MAERARMCVRVSLTRLSTGDHTLCARMCAGVCVARQQSWAEGLRSGFGVDDRDSPCSGLLGGTQAVLWESERAGPSCRELEKAALPNEGE